jgi:hypothetical protein
MMFVKSRSPSANTAKQVMLIRTKIQMVIKLHVTTAKEIRHARDNTSNHNRQQILDQTKKHNEKGHKRGR